MGDSVAGPLYEDVVETVWDKQDATGLVMYTDAAYWDRLGGDLDERCHDAWDVEFSGDESVSSWDSASAEVLPTRPRRNQRHCRRITDIDQSGGLDGVRRGAAGRIMR